jgi:hypothetical protein
MPGSRFDTRLTGRLQPGMFHSFIEDGAIRRITDGQAKAYL